MLSGESAGESLRFPIAHARDYDAQERLTRPREVAPQKYFRNNWVYGLGRNPLQRVLAKIGILPNPLYGPRASPNRGKTVMKVVAYSPADKSKETQHRLLEQLSPAWLREQKAPLFASTTIPKHKRASVYLRYSTDQQDPYSFDRQLEKARAYATVIGADIVKIYGDPGASGAYTAKRPSYNEMMEDAKEGKFDLLIIEEGDRLSRKLHITTTAYATLAQYGVEIHSTKHGKWSLIQRPSRAS